MNSKQDGQLWTFQLRIKLWLVLHGKCNELFLPLTCQPGQLCESDFTKMNDLAVTINGDLLVTDLLDDLWRNRKRAAVRREQLNRVLSKTNTLHIKRLVLVLLLYASISTSFTDSCPIRYLLFQNTNVNVRRPPLCSPNCSLHIVSSTNNNKL